MKVLAELEVVPASILRTWCEAEVDVTTSTFQWVSNRNVIAEADRTGLVDGELWGSNISIGSDPLFIAGSWYWIDVEDLVCRSPASDR